MSKIIQQGANAAGIMSIKNTVTQADIAATFGPITFASSNTGVFGLKTDSTPNTMDIEATGPGNAALTISTPATYQDPISGKIVTKTKSKIIPVSVVEINGVFAVTLG
jgi:hypothetical protein